MYLDCCLAKDLKTNWNETLSINCGIEAGSHEYDIFVHTETIEINFTVNVENMEKFAEKLSSFVPYNKEFLLSLNSKKFDDEYDIVFPKKSKEQEIEIDNKIKIFAKRGDKNKFKDYLNLKSGGRDQYSAMKLENLKYLVSSDIIDKVLETAFDEKYQAVTYRWVLRGLPVDMAIHKVKVDLEVTSNIKNC